ncbi:MAG: ABC transporter permease [Candidatus Aureabacteria bacterium]|nr:ABC transporter permease [Candidatus Auribacterota bacterium]
MINLSIRFSRVWHRNFDVFVKYMYVSLIGNLGDPILYLVAMGFGLGTFLGTIEGVSYVQFLAPGIIVSAAMFAATYECTYMSFLKMIHLKTYDAIIVTPVNIEDVVVGDIVWGTSKALFSAGIVCVVVAACGLMHSAWALLLPLLILIVGFHFASLAMCVTSTCPNFDYYSYFFELFITPLFFFSGIFFPLTHFPPWLRLVAHCSPLTHAVELSRALIMGYPPPHAAISVSILIIPAIILFYVSIVRMKKRIIK